MAGAALRDPDTRGREYLPTFDLEGPAELLNETVGHELSFLWGRQVLQENRELIAAQPSRGVAGPQSAPQTPRDRLQQLVTVVMTKAVIDDLESIKIDEEHAGRLVPPRRARKRLLQAIHEQRTIRQVGEWIVEGPIDQSILSQLALRDIAILSTTP